MELCARHHIFHFPPIKKSTISFWLDYKFLEFRRVFVLTALSSYYRHYLVGICLKVINNLSFSMGLLVVTKVSSLVWYGEKISKVWHGLVSAVMQTDGFEYLKVSCPSVISELLAYVARISEHFKGSFAYGSDTVMLDGGDMNGRRVKQRLFWVHNYL